MMKWLYKLEYKYRRFAIRNMILYILCAQAGVFVMDSMMVADISGLLVLDIGRVFAEGQLWRLVTFVFVPEGGNIVLVIIALLFYHFVSQSLEQTWGTFMLNAYYIIGMIFTILGSLICYGIAGFGIGTSSYLNMTLFFAFAALYPETPLRLFFVVEIKAKYVALVSAALLVASVVISVTSGAWYLAVSALMGVINFILFFWQDMRTLAAERIKYRKTRQNFNNQMREWENNRRRNGGNRPR